MGISTSSYAHKIIDLSDWGIENAEDITPIIYDVLACEGREDLTIRFPENGVYNFFPEKAFGKYHPITNHDNIYRYFAFPLQECKNIVMVRAQNSFFTV